MPDVDPLYEGFEFEDGTYTTPGMFGDVGTPRLRRMIDAYPDTPDGRVWRAAATRALELRGEVVPVVQ